MFAANVCRFVFDVAFGQSLIEEQILRDAERNKRQREERCSGFCSGWICDACCRGLISFCRKTFTLFDLCSLHIFNISCTPSLVMDA